MLDNSTLALVLHDENELQGSTSADPGFAPGLRRIILIDVSGSRHEVIIPIAGGIHFGGSNGSGKTSTMKLIPIFYGEEPNFIVKSGSGGKIPFCDHYLCNDTSYIVFEYSNHRGINCVVLHRSLAANGIGFVYKFLDGAYSPKAFIEETASGPSFIRVENFKAGLTKNGISGSADVSQINHYRAVIQHNARLLVQRELMQRMRDMERKYSLTAKPDGTGTPVPGIDRMISELMTENGGGSIAHLKTMVLNSVNLSALGFSGERVDIDPQLIKGCHDWPLVANAYRQLCDHKDGANVLLKNYDDYMRAEGALLQTYAQIKAHLTTSQNTAAQFAKTIVAKSAEMKVLVVTHESEREKPAAEIVDKKNEAGGKTRESVAIIEKQKQYMAENIEDLALLVDSISANEIAIEKLNAQHKAVMGGYENAAQAIEKQRVTAKEISSKNVEIIREALKTNERDLHAKAGVDRAESLSYYALLKESSDKEIAALEFLLEKHRFERSSADASLAAVTATPAELAGILNSKSLLVEMKALALAAEKSWMSAVNGEQEQKKERITLSHTHDVLSSRRIAAEKALLDVRQSQEPGEGTLWQFLAGSGHDWRETIGKAIRPELLNEKGLSPRLSEAPKALDGNFTSIYGVDLDLSSVEAHPQANEAVRLGKMKACQEVLDAAIEKLSASNSTLSANSKKLEALATALAGAQIEKEKSTTAVEAGAESVERAKSAVDLSIENRRNAVRKGMEGVKQREMNDTASMKVLRQQDATNRAASGAALVKIDGAKNKAILSAQELHLILNKDESARLKDEINSLDLAETQILAGEEKALLVRLQKEVHTLSESLVNAKQHIGLVANWRKFTSNELTRLPEIARDLDGINQVLERIEKAFELLKQSQTAARIDGRNAIEATEKLKREIDQVCKGCLDQLENIEKDVSNFSDRGLKNIEPEQCNLSWVDMAGNANSLRLKMRSLKGGIHADSGKIYEVFHGSAHLSARWYDLLVEERVSKLEANWSEHHIDAKRVEVIRAWFSPGGMHENERSSLVTQCSGLVTMAIGFSQKLESFKAAVNKFGGDLARTLSTRGSFGGIESIQFKVVASLVGEKNLSRLSALAKEQEYADFNFGGAYGIPGLDFSALMTSIHEDFSASGARSFDLSSLVEMEGSVLEKGKSKPLVIRSSKDFENISSTGLKMMCHLAIYVGFIDQIRRDSGVNFVFPADELLKLDQANQVHLIRMFDANNLTLLSGSPSLDLDIMGLIKNKVVMTRNPSGGFIVSQNNLD